MTGIRISDPYSVENIIAQIGHVHTVRLEKEQQQSDEERRQRAAELAGDFRALVKAQASDDTAGRAEPEKFVNACRTVARLYKGFGEVEGAQKAMLSALSGMLQEDADFRRAWNLVDMQTKSSELGLAMKSLREGKMPDDILNPEKKISRSR